MLAASVLAALAWLARFRQHCSQHRCDFWPPIWQPSSLVWRPDGFSRTVIIKPVYRDHLRQILITMGALIVAEQIILAIWGGSPISVPRPHFLAGSLIIGDVAIELYRLFAFALGLVAYMARSMCPQPDTRRPAHARRC